MQDTTRIDEHVTVGPQPTQDDITALNSQGFQSIVNFRTDGEDEQPLSPAAEKEAVLNAGMEYVNIPVSMKSMAPEVVDQFRDRYSTLPKPVFAHCKSGKRAGAMVMMHFACESGLSGEQTLRQADHLGFECDKPELKEFVKTYVDTHSRSA